MFDSVNLRELQPVEKYLMGCILPPHLSPFTDNRRDQTYIPPEERILLDPEYKLKHGNKRINFSKKKNRLRNFISYVLKMF